VVSTTTSTGMAELKRRLPSHIHKIYYPIDRRQYVKKAFQILGPEAVVLIEAEIWPNFLWQAQRQRVPVFLVNARLSDRSFRGYRRFGFLFRPLFASLAGVGVPNQADADRLIELGCRPEVLHVLGNLKFDAVKIAENRFLDVGRLLRQLGVPEEARILLGGSTHAGEETLLADLFLRLRTRFPNLFLILVPRHQERGKEVGRLLEERKIRFTYRSLVTDRTQQDPGSCDCLLVNTTGELKFFYEHATVVFVGKSLAGKGGQNPIEPAALGKPVLFGPHMQNFESIAKDFVQAQAAIQVKTAAELETAVADLLANESRRAEMGRRAIDMVSQNRGALDRTVDMILPHLRREDVYVAR
jgi:3-deoxy-D-manno-octulosonic-acid transferase